MKFFKRHMQEDTEPVLQDVLNDAELREKQWSESKNRQLAKAMKKTLGITCTPKNRRVFWSGICFTLDYFDDDLSSGGYYLVAHLKGMTDKIIYNKECLGDFVLEAKQNGYLKI